MVATEVANTALPSSIKNASTHARIATVIAKSAAAEGGMLIIGGTGEEAIFFSG